MSCFCHGRRLMVGQSGNLADGAGTLATHRELLQHALAPAFLPVLGWFPSRNIVGGILKFIHQVAETV